MNPCWHANPESDAGQPEKNCEKKMMQDPGPSQAKPRLRCSHAGLNSALALLEPIKQKFPAVSYADLYQLASALAVEVGCTLPVLKVREQCSGSPLACQKLKVVCAWRQRKISCSCALCLQLAGGPKIDLKLGRLDTAGPDECPKEGNLPGKSLPLLFPGQGSSVMLEHCILAAFLP